MSTRLTIKSRQEILGKLRSIAFTKRSQTDWEKKNAPGRVP